MYEEPPFVPRRPRLIVVTPTYPPTPCGIGDYSRRLASELSEFEVTTVTATENRVDSSDPDYNDSDVVFGFRRSEPSTLLGVLEVARSLEPDWILVQYCPTAYGGRHGFDASMPRLLRGARRLPSAPRVGLVVHETYAPVDGLRRAPYQAASIVHLGLCARVADLLIVPVESWRRRVRRFAGRASVIYAPVGSNIDVADCERKASRAALGIGPSDVAIGLLGRLPAERGIRSVTGAIEEIRRDGRRVVLVYTGQDAERVRGVLDASDDIVAACGIGAAEVSRRLQTVDLFLAPFGDGASSRRTSLMAAMAHGLPIVSTRGAATDTTLASANGDAFVLADVADATAFARAARSVVATPELARRLGSGALRLFAENYAWERVAGAIGQALSDGGTSRGTLGAA